MSQQPPKVPTREPLVSLNFRVPKLFRKEWKALAVERDLTATALLERALELLRKDKPQKP